MREERRDRSHRKHRQDVTKENINKLFYFILKLKS